MSARPNRKHQTIATKSVIAGDKNREQAVTRSAILFIAGFGDIASMFEGLSRTHLAEMSRLLPINLPGFGSPALVSRTTLEALAELVWQCGLPLQP